MTASQKLWPDDRPRGGEWAPIYRSLKLVFSVDGKCVFAASFHGDVHEPPKNVIRVRKGYPLQHDICINFSTLGAGSQNIEDERKINASEIGVGRSSAAKVTINEAFEGWIKLLYLVE